MHLAVTLGHLECARILFRHGANANTENAKYWSGKLLFSYSRYLWNNITSEERSLEFVFQLFVFAPSGEIAQLVNVLG